MSKYHITWDIQSHPEGKTTRQVEESGRGACDAFVFLSILREDSGGFSLVMVSGDGETERELTADEQFSAWVLMGAELAGSDALSEPKRRVCKAVFDMVREAVARVRKGAED